MRDPWEAEEATDQVVEAAKRRIARLGGVEPHAACGRAAGDLVQYGSSVDLLIVAPHRRANIARLVHGCVTVHLAHAAPCPLLLLTGPQPAQGR